MKTSHKLGLLILAVGLAVWIKAAPGDGLARKPNWEYWTAHGTAGVVMPGTESRLKQGFEVDRLEIAPAPPGEVQAYVVVVLRREK